MTLAGISCRQLLALGHVASYTYPGYWADASTIAYWDAPTYEPAMAEEPALNLVCAGVGRAYPQPGAGAGQASSSSQTWMGHCSPMAARSRAPSNAKSCLHGVQVGNLARSSGIASSSMIQSSNRAQSSERCVIAKEVRVCQDARVGHSENNWRVPGMLPARLNTGLSLLGTSSIVPAGIQCSVAMS